mgnify:FL=1|tara:strand:- start:837 stop:1289 length:453 start_codon:yes stop_codon:yes gene_type:complete
MMFDIFLNLNKREKNLIILALAAISFFIVFLLSKNIIDSYSLSSQKLLKAKNDYEYVISKAELLNSSLISNSTDVNQIEAFIKDLFSNPANDLKVENLKESLRISFRTNNIKDAVTISDEIAKNLQRQLTKISYSKDEQDTLVELYFINF